MSMTAKMYVDDMVYNIRRLDFSFYQKVNTNGTAATHPLGGLFNIEIESPKKTHLYAWGASKFDMKHVRLVFSPVTLASKSRTIELYDTLCICHHDHFHSESKDPMISVIQLSPAIVVQDGRTMFEKNWKVTDLSRQNAEPTPLPVSSAQDDNAEETEPSIVECYYTDLEGKKITDLPIGNVFLILNSQNAIGDVVDINLSDDKMDFKYKGVILNNDILKNYKITQNTESIELEVIAQKI